VAETVHMLNTIRKKVVLRLEYWRRPSWKSSSSILCGQIKGCAGLPQQNCSVSKDPGKRVLWTPASQTLCCTLLCGLLFPVLAGF